MAREQLATREARGGKSVGARVEKGAFTVFRLLWGGANGPLWGLWKHLALKLGWKLRSAAAKCILSVGPEVDIANSGIHIDFRQCNQNATNLAVTDGFEMSPIPR
jgi:hypothetical protein